MARDIDLEDESSALDTSSPNSGFVEREDDGETLWEVSEILAEKGKLYKVRWVGIDPATNMPWAPSWVPKSDCTNPLVKAWRLKKAKQKKGTSRKAAIQRDASATSTHSKTSVGSSATATRSTASGSNKSKSAAGAKRKNEDRVSSRRSTSRDSPMDIVSSSRPRKKRKIAVETMPNPGSPLKENSERVELSGKTTIRREEEEEEEYSIAQIQIAKYRKRSKIPAFDLKSDGDEEPPPKVNSKEKPKAIPSTSTQWIHRISSTHSSTTSSPRLAPTATRSTPPSSASPHAELSTKVEHESEDEGDVEEILVPRKSRNGAAAEQEREDESDSAEASPPPKRQRVRGMPHAGAFIRSRSLSAESDATSIRTRWKPGSGKNKSDHRAAVAQTTGQSPKSSIDPETPPASPSTIAAPKLNGQTKEDTGSAKLNGQVNTRDDDSNSGLEYADFEYSKPQSPLPPSTPTKPSLFLPGTPTPTPPPLDRKTRPREPDVVPETEAEESQSSQARNPRHLTRTPSKNSVVSRMKPRTPGSKRNVLDADLITSPHFDVNDDYGPQRTKSLHSLPQIPPSTFLPHLPSSIVESVEDADGNDSSIEQFDSPVQPKAEAQPSDVVPDSVAPKSSVWIDSSPKDTTSTETAKRGNQRGNGVSVSKLPLTSLVGREKEKARPFLAQGSDRSSPEVENVPATLEEFADSFVDYDGGMGSGEDGLSRTEDPDRNTAVDVEKQQVYLQQEEEENTQDILNELAEQRAAHEGNEGWMHPSVAESQHQSGEEDARDLIDSLEVAPKCSAPMDETVGYEQSQEKSSSQSSSQSTDRRSPSLEIPPTISPARPLPEPLYPPQNGSHHLESAMNLLNKKSEEISRLEALFVSAQTTLQELQVESADLKAAAITWMDEKAVLTTSVESAKRRQELAEKDVDFFREQYTRASAFVSEVQHDNTALQERAEVAETQATNGLKEIRAMFETRVRQLEDEAKHHKLVATFLIEQSQRTGDDEIRRRAAEYPEMKRKYSEMEDMLSGATEMVAVFERQLRAKDQEIEKLRREKGEVQEEREVLRQKVEGLEREIVEPKQEPDVEIKENGKVERVDGEIQVYRCLWRKDGKDQCDAMFLTKGDLERHLETGGHLQ